ncbi:hypothetical protein [Haloarchaeobius iranensis]|uniref:Uncharacterized protein n=1 Tax=Haloarchaeobius iranensis TaxID=996166 RepID=A0A1G9W761_9EURY|nr:hypothetical protein [Haloarchaeobius iranensis]SDM80329.1 hypothetical protein SAMN05192554_107194 [Haloarchaeobius iranensis]
MTAVTTDGARIGVEHSDHAGCSFPCFLVTATSMRAVTNRAGHERAQRRVGTAGVARRPAATASTTRAPAE